MLPLTAILALVILHAIPTSAASSAGALPKGAIVDLSHPYDAKTIFWPTESGFVLEPEHDGLTDKGYYYRSNKFSAPEHGGTHIDAPAHFAKDGNFVDAIPLEQLVGAAVVVDVSRKCQADRDYRITIDDFRDWEKAYREIPAHAIVLLRTGFGKYWPDRKSYIGTDERGPEAVPKLHFPGLDPAAAGWLVRERKIKAVGLDTASIDYGQSTLFETHVELMTHNVPAMENLANLEQLPPTGITVVALPMKIAGGSGGPLRAIAIIEER
jgi:kynurenine formamidase